MKWIKFKDNRGTGHNIKIKVESGFALCYKKSVKTCMKVGGEITACARESAMDCGQRFPAGVIERRKRGPKAF